MCLSILGLPHNNIFRLELKVNILELIEKCHVVNTKGPHKHGLLVGLGTQNSGGVKKTQRKGQPEGVIAETRKVSEATV
jgi:hypothetical protein